MNVTRSTEKTTGSHSSTASCSSVTGGQASCANYTLTNTTQAFTITSPPPSHPPDATSCDTWWYSYSGYCVDTSTGYNYQTTHTDKGKKGKSAASTACENYNPCTSPYTEQNPTCNVYVQWGIGYYSEGKTKSGGPYATRDAAVNACKSHNPCWITCG